MNCIEDFLLLISKYFTKDIYLLTAKTQAIIWSAADTILIFFFLKIINFIRLKANKEKALSGYIFLWISTFFIFLIPFAGTFQEFSILEAIVCSIQFSILITALLFTRKDLLLFLEKLIKKSDIEPRRFT